VLERKINKHAQNIIIAQTIDAIHIIAAFCRGTEIIIVSS